MIKYVNIDKLLQDSGLLGQEQLHLQAVKARLDTGAELARSRDETMEDTVKSQAMQMVSEEGLVAIMPLQGALAVSETMDITEQMSGRLKHHSLSFADLPEVSLKEADVKEADVKEENLGSKKPVSDRLWVKQKPVALICLPGPDIIQECILVPWFS